MSCVLWVVLGCLVCWVELPRLLCWVVCCVCLCLCASVCMCVCACVYVTCVCVSLCVCVCMCVRTRVYRKELPEVGRVGAIGGAQRVLQEVEVRREVLGEEHGHLPDHLVLLGAVRHLKERAAFVRVVMTTARVVGSGSDICGNGRRV